MDTGLVIIAITGLTGLSLHIAARFFTSAEELRPRVNLLAEDLKKEQSLRLQSEMEDDVMRSYGAAAVQIVGLDFPSTRRGRAAKTMSKSIWDNAVGYAPMRHSLTSLSRWEHRGQFSCGIGTFLNIGVATILLVLVLVRPGWIPVDERAIWIAVAVVSVPTLSAASCFIFAHSHKSALVNTLDQ